MNACHSVSSRDSGRNRLGVQVVAGSNPVAPTIEAPVVPRETGSGGGFVFSESGSRPARAPRSDLHLPSAVPSFLEACAKLAGEAAARGDFGRARALVEKAARVAALRERGA